MIFMNSIPARRRVNADPPLHVSPIHSRRTAAAGCAGSLAPARLPFSRPAKLTSCELPEQSSDGDSVRAVLVEMTPA
jgi:hypothetical protein